MSKIKKVFPEERKGPKKGIKEIIIFITQIIPIDQKIS